MLYYSIVYCTTITLEYTIMPTFRPSAAPDVKPGRADGRMRSCRGLNN